MLRLMAFRGAFVTYSELFDTMPGQEELLATVRHLSLERAMLILSHVNLTLRHAMDAETDNFGKLQVMLAETFCDEETKRRFRERFAFKRAEERPLLVPIECLNAMKAVVGEAIELDPVPLDEILQHHIGKICLMIGNLLLRKEEKEQIETGDKDSRRLALMVQMLAPFEMGNPVRSHRLVLRYQRMYRTVLQQTNVKNRISRECGSFDFDDVFKRLTNISLERWLHSIFVIHGYYSIAANPWQPNNTYFLIDPSNFVGQSDLSSDEANAIFATISNSIPDLKKELATENHTDPRFDLLPFRSRPLVKLSGGKLLCLDSTFLLDQVHTGVHWVMHDRLSRRERGDLFKAWGVLFEEYLHYLFEGMETNLPIRYYRSPKWVKGTKDNIDQESFDGIFVKNTVLFPLEFKGGFLSRKARYSGNVDLFTSEMREKFAGPQQLAWKIGALFSDDEKQRRSIEPINADAYEVVVPVLVFHDHILRVPFLNWWLNLEFQRELVKHRLRPGLRVAPLSVASVREIEAMVNSAETSDFDFLYALHHRTVRDPEMLSVLPEFLSQFPTYGQGNSKRVQAILDEFGKELFRTMFPGEEPISQE
jgi:hypothetical protein